MTVHQARPPSTGLRAALLTGLFVLAVGSRLFWGVDVIQSGDAPDYRLIAENLLAGHGFSLSTAPPYEPTSRRAPGYPWFMTAVYALAGRSDTVVLRVQAVLGGVACLLLVRLLAPIFGVRTGLVASAVVAAHPVLARGAGAIMNETLYIVFLIQLVTLFDRSLKTSSPVLFAATGLFVGLAALIRPLTGGLLLFLWIGIWLWRKELQRPLRNALLMATVAMAVILPWQIRNLVIFGRMVPLQVAATGTEIWIATLPIGEQPMKSYAETIKSWERKYPEWSTPDFYGDGRPNQTLRQLAWEQHLTRVGIRRVIDDPMAYVASRIRQYPYLWLYSQGNSWLASVTFAEARQSGDFVRWTAKALFLLVFSVVPLALAATVWLAPDGWRGYYALWMVPLFIALVHLPIYVEYRYSTPAQPFLWGLACGSVQLLRARRTIRSPVPATHVAVLGAGD